MTPQEHKSQPLAGRNATHILVHYSEVGLKGKNRGRFENRLMKNIRAAVGLSGAQVHRLFGRLAIRLEKGQRWDDIAPKVCKVFGVAYVLPAVSCDATIEDLRTTLTPLVSGIDEDYSFAVKCQRSSKSLPFTSMDVQRELGTHIQSLTKWSVNLDHPDILVRVELVNNFAYVGIGRMEGPGGLPTGVSGRVTCLMSGGIDSPVAAYKLMQRGSLAIYVHFHSYPHTSVESQEKVRDLVRQVHPVGIRSRLYMVPFAELQRKIVTECVAGLRVILYRRFMVRVAAVIAERERALALVTGESLGQVASQTLENLRTIDEVSMLPILRPLIGMDKIEIINEARRIGTYETSIEPHDDCCSYLMPAAPATHSTPEDLTKAEKVFDIDQEVEALVDQSEVSTVGVDSPGDETDSPPHAAPQESNSIKSTKPKAS